MSKTTATLPTIGKFPTSCGKFAALLLEHPPNKKGRKRGAARAVLDAVLTSTPAFILLACRGKPSIKLNSSVQAGL